MAASVLKKLCDVWKKYLIASFKFSVYMIIILWAYLLGKGFICEGVYLLATSRISNTMSQSADRGEYVIGILRYVES